MKKYFFLFSSVAVLMLLTACETFDSSSRNSQFAASSRDIAELRNDLAALNNKVVSLQNTNSRIVKHLSSLQRQINYVNEQNLQGREKFNALEQTIKQERAERQAALSKVVETVADQTAKTVNSIAKQIPARTAPAKNTMTAGAYYKHKVESGQTLSAIARAYKVSVSDIKDANHLKSDIIRVGQILHIPKK